jgi:hypothetical protein
MKNFYPRRAQAAKLNSKLDCLKIGNNYSLVEFLFKGRDTFQLIKCCEVLGLYVALNTN